MYRNLTMLYFSTKDQFWLSRTKFVLLSGGIGVFNKHFKYGIYYTIIRRMYLAMCLCWSGRLLSILDM